MHEYSKRIADHIKECYSNLSQLTQEDLCELEKWSAVICSLTDYDKNMRIIKAMDEEEKEEKSMMRMGYNRNRASNGRYTSNPPKSRNSRMMGYKPYLEWDDDEYMRRYLDDGPDFMLPEMMNPRMGYTQGNMNRNSQSNAENQMSSRYGKNYDSYRNARRSYTETHNAEDKSKMNQSAEEIFDDIETMAMDIWSNVDPNDKPKYKQRWNAIMQRMN